MNVGNVKATKDVIDCNGRKTVREVSECTGISKSSVQRILTSQLKMSCERSVGSQVINGRKTDSSFSLHDISS